MENFEDISKKEEFEDIYHRRRGLRIPFARGPIPVSRGLWRGGVSREFEDIYEKEEFEDIYEKEKFEDIYEKQESEDIYEKEVFEDIYNRRRGRTRFARGRRVSRGQQRGGFDREMWNYEKEEFEDMSILYARRGLRIPISTGPIPVSRDLWRRGFTREERMRYLYQEMEEFENMSIYDILCKGFHLRDRKVYYSLGSNGEQCYLVSAAKFSYKNKAVSWEANDEFSWLNDVEPRFPKVANMINVWDLNIHIKMRTPFLSKDINYLVNLIFKFRGFRSEKPHYVNLTYKIGSQTFHAYFAIPRDKNKDWMKIELCRFLNYKEKTNFEVLLESFSRAYCSSSDILVQGIEFQSIDNVKQEGIDVTMDVQKQLPSDSDNRSEYDDDEGGMLLLSEVSQKKHLKLPAMDVLYDTSKVKPFHLKPSVESRIQEGIELLPQQVFGIKCKIESQMLSPDTNYMCYLVFKLSKKCPGLHCPVRVRNEYCRYGKNEKIGLVCFRPPNQWNSHDNYWVPKMREDGWMEVKVWKFNSTSKLNRNDRIPMHLKLITYEGTMSGLIVSGLVIRPM